MNTIFKFRQDTYNLRNFHAFKSQNPRTNKFGPDSIAYRASQLWNNVLEATKFNLTFNLQRFNKKGPLISCSCHCFKTYIDHVSYI